MVALSCQWLICRADSSIPFSLLFRFFTPIPFISSLPEPIELRLRQPRSPQKRAAGLFPGPTFFVHDLLVKIFKDSFELVEERTVITSGTGRDESYWRGSCPIS